MKMVYDRDKDIMLLEVAKGKVDYAEEAGPIIVHFSKKRRPLLLEFLDASEFIANITRASLRSKTLSEVKIAV